MRILHASALLFATTLGAAASGCGGKVAVDDSTVVSGGSGTGGSGTGGSGTSGTGGSGTCPVLSPNNGDPCSTPGLTCSVAVCCGGTAVCNGATWHVSSIPCTEPCLPCPGTLGCAIGAVCVDNPQGGGPVPATPHYNCAVDPCQGVPLSCSCASSLCEVGPCGKVSGTQVECISTAP